MISVLGFYFVSALAVLSALGVIFAPRPTHSLLSLMMTMVCLSVLYLSLGAPFVAMVNLIVYAGAVLVLFLFVIMFLGLRTKDVPLLSRFHPAFLPAACLTGSAFLLILVRLSRQVSAPSFHGISGQMHAIGMALFTKYLLPFEVISLLLMLAIFAAVALGKEEETRA